MILALNCGSSSLKWAIFDGDREVRRATVERVGDHGAAVAVVLDEVGVPEAIGHRVVHGGERYGAPVRIDDAVTAELARLIPLAPLHLPVELAAIAAVRARLPEVPQVACFDTAFHRTLPEVAWRYPLPAPLGVRRFGFHGLSYESIVARRPDLARAVIAHLGSGSSLVAIRDGISVDTTMGFSPTGGIVMGTRPGDLDPGLVLYLLEHCYTRAELAHVLEHESGLRAISETTSDMQDLLARRATDPRARLAIDIYCASARKAIGAFATVLGGVDTLVFTGGIGQHAAPIRAQICDGLEHLRIGEVCAMPTDEERVIARATRALSGTR